MSAAIEMTANEARTQRKAPQGDWLPADYDLRDTWFPVAHSRDVGAEPVRRVVHAQPYFLWRDRGVAKAAEFHPEKFAQSKRLASLFTGGSGYYPVIERYGYIWAWYGNPDNVSEELLPHVPYLNRDRSVPNYMKHTVRSDACAPLCVENLIGVAGA